MSGVFGIVDLHGRVDVGEMAEHMANAMRHREWHDAHYQADPARGVAIGHIGIGLLNSAPQPICNDDRTIVLTMAGEFYNRPAHMPNDEAWALALYQQYDAAFVRQLDGAFVIAIADFAQGKFIVANDRLALYPTYYALHAGRLIFAPEIKAVQCDCAVPKQLDDVAVAQYLRFQRVLGMRTFFEDIKRLPFASVLSVDLHTGQASIQPYWSAADIPERATIKFDDAVAEAGRLLRAAVQRQLAGSLRPSVFLSGGLDSRAIVGLAQRPGIPTFTWGVRDCRDVIYAERIARAVGSEHHWHDLPDGNWVREWADLHLDLTEGLHTWTNMHGLSMLPDVRARADVVLSGWDGGTVMAMAEDRDWTFYDIDNDDALIDKLFQTFVTKSSWPGPTEFEAQQMFTPQWRNRVQGLALASFAEELQPYLGLRHGIRGDMFFVHNHCLRLTQSMITFYRSHIEVRFPFFDQALFDFMFSIPASMRANRKLWLALLQREVPHLTTIPYDHDDQLPTTRRLARVSYALAGKVRRRINRYVAPGSPQYKTLYADYESYLRHELRGWAEGILFDPRTGQRGIVNLDFVRSLLERHYSGHEQWLIGKIAPLMTLEMTLRRLSS